MSGLSELKNQGTLVLKWKASYVSSELTNMKGTGIPGC